jgi:AcrR family transcriptional regulator
MQDIFTEAGLSAGAVYSHFSGKDEIVGAIADEVIDTVTEALAPATAGDPPNLDELFDHLFTTLQRANVATIAITVWAEALRDPALGRRLSTRYQRMRRQLTELVAAHQQRGTIDSQISASAVAQVLTALGPAFLHQRAFDSAVSATTFTRGLQALLYRPYAQSDVAARNA